ncbi:MAG TPA: family 78 glycoside hydrolase catalytic domain [Verrucomicrobiae bacterium]|nr:family 78 glycoside hydrolase catalytic domain [Verrucomicrobiae bacterium]
MRNILALGFCLAAACVVTAATQPVQLRSEYRENPVGVDAPSPRLSWVLPAAERGARQTAYQVLVAGDADALNRGQGDLWDTGKVNSDQSIQLPYAGRTLAAGQTCYWKVRVWDQTGAASPWSHPARWTMGLLQPSDWHAQWIGFKPGHDAADALAETLKPLTRLDENHWVWLAGAVSGDQSAGAVYFRKEIQIPAGRAIRAAEFVLTADDTLQLYVNGAAVGLEHHNWKQLAVRDLKPALHAGANVLAILARNSSQGPAGLLGRLGIVFADGGTLTVPVDGSWLSSAGETPDWNAAGFDAKDWQPAAEIVAFGDKHWGRPAREVMSPAPFFRKDFAVTKPVKRATIFATALGVYELHLNGQPVDTDALSPGWTDFSKRVNYRGYDVTAQLRRGENALGAILGDGWYASFLAFTGKRHYYGGDPRLLVQLQIEYRDGTRELIGTDASWRAALGPIRQADLLMGCVYDARLEFPGWDRPGFDASQWQAAQVDPSVTVKRYAHPGEPIRRTDELAAQAITEPKPGVYVFDLGQNMVGWVRLLAKGRPGQQVVVRHAEMLNPDGTLYTTNLRAARATDTYYLAGHGKRAYEPSFTFHGFRYVEVTGLNYRPRLGDVTGIVVHSDLPRAGWFECSEPLVNKLVLNSLWGQKGNFLDVPTDCPQRDERAGWTGDAQVFMKTACLNMDAPAFYTKWLRDLCTDSQRDDGAFDDVAPHLAVVGYGNTGWSDAGPVCNWRMYELYGDTRVLREHYPELLHYMDYLAQSSQDYVRGTGAYGDWLRLAGPQHSDAIGTAYYFYTASLMERIATALGETGDAQRFHALADHIRAAFARHFIKPDGRIVDAKNETGQTFYALAFGLDLVPAELKTKVAAQFVESLHDQQDHIATGFLGTPFILFALEQAGHPELSYHLVLNKTYPSWLQQVLWGSTTMWERWDGWRPDKGFQDPGMNSFNHYWLGCVSEWLFTQAAGIDTDGPGFQHIVIHPQVVPPGQGFHWVNATYDSIRGPITSRWRRAGRQFHLAVSIPGNCTATVYVPAADATAVTESGRPADQAHGVRFLRMADGCAVFAVEAGHYKFTARAVGQTL